MIGHARTKKKRGGENWLYFTSPAFLAQIFFIIFILREEAALLISLLHLISQNLINYQL